jgi:endonuclease/exonuclease/phosphatase family metal-dependent hydrolase
MRLILLFGLAACGGPMDTDPADTEDSGPLGSVEVRVATWNVLGLGRPGSASFNAVKAVLARIDADVVGLNEIGEDEASALATLASDLGYSQVLRPPTNPFGPERNAILSRLPASLDAPTSATLSGDRAANDVTRLPVRAVIPLPEVNRELTVVGQHWKSGFDLVDRFRRAVDASRSAQAARGDLVVLMGDVNAEPGDMPEDPPVWKYRPQGLPGEYRLGSDLEAQLAGSGLPNDAFAPGTAAGLVWLPARQVDGREVTRPSSGRRIDWIFVSDEVSAAPSEVYDSTDEGKGGLPKSGEVPARDASELASDHLPVFADLTISEQR